MRTYLPKQLFMEFAHFCALCPDIVVIIKEKTHSEIGQACSILEALDYIPTSELENILDERIEIRKQSVLLGACETNTGMAPKYTIHSMGYDLLRRLKIYMPEMAPSTPRSLNDPPLCRSHLIPESIVINSPSIEDEKTYVKAKKKYFTNSEQVDLEKNGQKSKDGLETKN